MDLKQSYINARKKTKGDEKAPWYTRWVWWLVIALVGVGVFALWYFAKQREAKVAAQLKVATDIEKKERLKALAEKDREKAAEHLTQANAAKALAKNLEAELEASSNRRKDLEAAIKGATSWEELEAIEKELQ